MKRIPLARGLSGVSLVASLLVGGPLRAEEDEPVAAPQPVAGEVREEVPVGEEPELAWLDSLAAGYTAAQRQGQPIIVRAGGESCPWCRVLEREIARPAAQEELARWTRVAIDVDASPEDARLLTVGPIPALRVLTPAGKLVASREGAMTAEEFVGWLRANYDEASVVPPESLATTGPPSGADVRELIAEFAQRDGVLREAAVQRLLPYPERAADGVVAAFEQGPLASRLAALELLREWQAPVEGLDPWRPETITEERVGGLTKWAEGLDVSAATGQPTELSAEDLAAARQAIAQMLAAELPEARAIRERLARHGRLLLPEVYAQLQTAETDAERERLTALRYRLAASAALALEWSGGLERLAATDLDVRQQAADELARRATAADEPLLLELFSDPAPLVREISLKALRQVGTSGADSALVRLLDDPDANVRAAVLKQLAEDPPAGIVSKVAEYVKRESDHDLVVHAVRLLRAAKGRAAFDALQPLLAHESWRVRAEAATGIGETIDRNNNGGSDADRVTPEEGDRVLIEILDDPDGFVVSRAVEALEETTLADAVDPLAQAALTHPDLARSVVRAFSYHRLPQERVEPHLRRFASHESPQIRAAAIGGLTTLLGDGAQEPLRTALHDESADVRIAAADALFVMLEGRRPVPNDPTVMLHREVIDGLAGVPGPPVLINDGGRVVEIPAADIEPPPSRGLLGGGFDLFGGNEPEPPPPVPVPVGPGVNWTVEDGSAQVVEVDPDAPVEAPMPESAGTRTDHLLQLVRRREVFAAWQHELAAPLMTMIASESAEERLAAARPLVVLGHDAEATPILMAVAESHPRMLPRVADALPWLFWPDRKALFDRLADVAAGPDELGQLARSLAEVPEDRAADAIWGLYSRDDMVPTAAYEVHEALLSLYVPYHVWNPTEAPPEQKSRATAAAVPRATSGPRWQRASALSLLLWLDKEAARVAAEASVADETLDPLLRADAFQALLLAGSPTSSEAAAIEAIGSNVAEIRGRALIYLTMGATSLMTLESGKFELVNTNAGLSLGVDQAATAGEPIVPGPPTGLSAEALLPLLRSGDPREAALAGYLLVLLDHPEGLPVLVDYWRSRAPQHAGWTRLVYRAVAFADDSRYVPVLRSIYQDIARQRYPDYDEFYWTIRIMTGPEALALRKEIRNEVGMDELR